MVNWEHGGPDAAGVPRWDFSTNSNACGPCPSALAALQAADATHYPDPHYTRLRAELAEFHGVSPQRVLLAASASEAISRISAYTALHSAPRSVWLPPQHYGDYARAAQVWGLARVADPDQAALLWACEPSSPLGQAHSGLAAQVRALRSGQRLVLDCAYAPLRLSGQPSLDAAQLNHVWQLWTPNKALGLTGVRAAYVLAPLGAEADVAALSALAPSWPLGAHGVALLHAWVSPATQTWVAESLHTLADWKARQQTLCQSLGWAVQPSSANYFVAALSPAPSLVPGGDLPWLLAHLRAAHGIKLRDAASFGLPGQVRLGVLPPAAQDALAAALAAWGVTSTMTSDLKVHA
jgi:histidinol-phosphate aminotransferase